MGMFSFPKEARLTQNHEYTKVYRAGRRIPSANFLLFFLASPAGHSRIGLSSGKKVGGAVVRNRVKRRMREIMRKYRTMFAFAADVVVVAHPQAANLTQQQMEGEIVRLLKSARLLSANEIPLG